MKKLKQVICGLMACLMLADPVSMCSTAYAEENEPAEPEAILQMAPVEQEGTSLLQEAEQQETGGSEQEATGTADTSAPELDVSSLHIEYDAELGGKATLTYRVTDESEIADVSCHIMVCANGLRTANYIDYCKGSVKTDGVVTETFRLNFYGKYEIVSISMRDVWGNATAYYNSAYSGYEGQLPAADLSVATISLPAPMEDNDPPVIDIDSIRLEKAVIANGEDNAMQLSVADATGVAELYAQFRNIENGKTADAITATALGGGIFSLQIHKPFPGEWQLFFVDAIDVCGNTVRLINAKHPYYSGTYGAENLCDLSAIVFEVEAGSFATPVIDLASLSIDKNISRNREAVEISVNVENPASVRQLDITYIVPTDGGDGALVNAGPKLEYYTSGQFKGRFYPSYFGRYEVTWISILDYNGEWQTIHNSALSRGWTLPEDAVTYDLSVLNFDSIDTQIYTMEGLKSALAEAQDGERLQIAASENFIIDEDITIPKGVYLNIQSGSGSFKIAEGVTFTTEFDFTCYVPMTVEGTWLSQSANVRGVTVNGTWENRGNTYCQEEVYVADTAIIRHSKGNDFYCGGGLRIAEGGLVENDGYLHIDEKYENAGTLTNNAGATARLVLSVENAAELKAALACENPGEKEINFWVSDAVTLTEDTVIPENTRLFAYDSSGNGKATLTVGEGVTLTTQSKCYCNIPLTIAGKWVNHAWGVELKKGLTITSTGCVDSTEGRIELTGAFVNDGVLVENSSISQTLNIDSMDELRSAVQKATSGGTLQAKLNSDLTISEDYTIPEGVYLNIQSGSGSFKIAEGVTFTTGSRFTCYVPMTVEGTWLNQSAYVEDLTISASGLIENNKDMDVRNFRIEGSLKNKEQASMYSWNEFVLTSAGTLENYGRIYLEGNFALDGTVTEHPGSQIYYTYKAKTLDELKELLKRAKAGDTVEVDPGNSAFVIGEDVSVPEGVRLNISGDLVINAGVTFSTANLDVHGVTVNGTWENRGNASCQEEVYVADTGVIRHSNGNDFYCWGGLRIAEGGLVENNGYLHIGGKYENRGTLVNNTGATARLVLSVWNTAELKAALACENPGEKEINFWVSDAVTLTEDVVISENTRLFVYDSSGNGKATLTVGEGATLITGGHFDFTCDVPLTVAGTWVNRTWGVELKKGLTITSTGCVDSTGGSIDLTGAFVNDGVLVKDSYIHQTLIARSMDELRSAVQGVTSRGKVEIRGNSDFTISEDITIPKGITVEVYEDIQNLRLEAGAKLTIDTGATLQSYAPIEVGGTVYNYGSIGARRGMTVNGTIHNYDYILVEGGELVRSDNVITHEAGMRAIRQNYFVDSEQALDEVLAEVDLGKWNWNTITVDEGFTLNGDVTIPRGVYLKIQSGTLKVSTGTKLVTYDNLDVAGNMVVNGHWTNNYGTAISSVAGELVVNGTVENGGHLELHQYTEAFQQKRIQNVDRGRIDYSLTVYSLAELRNLIARGIYWPMSVYWPANDTVILDDDLSIPNNMSLYINGQRTTLIIPEGVVLCTGTDKFDASYGNVIVQGVLHTDGNCGFNTIEVSGLLENAGGLSFDNMLITDSGKVTNAGVMVGKVDNQGELCNIDRTDAGKAFELELRRNCDWNDVFRNIRHGDSVRFTSFGDNSYIVVSKDTTLPEGVSLHCGNFKITEGVTLTTKGSMEDVSTINVDGVWVNNGIANAYNIAGTGTICNAGGIVAYEIGDEVKITGRPIQKEEDDSVIYASQLNLQETLDAAKRGQIVRCVRTQIYSSGQCGIVFNEDITVPEGVTLQFVGVAKAYFAANHMFIVNGTLVAAQPVYIAGSLVINGEVSIPAANEIDVEYLQYLGVTMGGINIVDGGSCEINGSIRVGKTDYNGQPITDPLSVLEGVDTSMLTQRTEDGCWYLTKKTAEGRADIFCELPTAGCSLRLISADGSVKELAPSGKGAAITNIAPGRYTLEVSKPGYVAHSISVDTATIADTLAVELVMVGDVNGCASKRGDVDVTDMACLYTLLSTGRYDGKIKDEEYMKRVADVNGDNSVNILDYQALYMMVK